MTNRHFVQKIKRNDTPTLRRRAGHPFDSGSGARGSFQGQASSGSETLDRRILPGFASPVECALRRHIGWIARLLTVFFNMQGLLKKFLSNNKLSSHEEVPH
jgi:hypothetical protein